MGKLWGRKNIDKELRAARPEPRDELVSELTERAGVTRVQRRWSRVAFASAVTVLMLGSFASFGGLGYAASSVEATAKAVKQTAAPAKKVKVAKQSAANDQYGARTTAKPKPKPKIVATPPTQSSAGAAGAAAQSSETLPFTGISLAGTAVLGAALLVLGFILRRREARE
jgi:predicted ribonuclease toxin of YeeF-YezG toxin-antitoxin module